MSLTPSSSKNNDAYRSPSIPSEIGYVLEHSFHYANHHDHHIPSLSTSSSSVACLGISRPTYGNSNNNNDNSTHNDEVDTHDDNGTIGFSPILQSKKRLSKHSSYHSHHSHQHLATTTLATNNDIRSTGVGQLESVNHHQDGMYNHDYSSHGILKSPTALQNPIKALKQVTTRSSTMSSKLSGSSPHPSTTTVAEENSNFVSSMNLDGSIDMNRSIMSQVQNAMHQREMLKNDRFFIPAQQYDRNLNQSQQSPSLSFFRHRRQKNKKNNVTTISPSATTDEDVPRLCAATSDSQTSHKTKGIGIAPPPSSSTSRIIVPYVTPDDSKTAYSFTVFILLIQPSQKIFELVRINYDPSSATLKHLLDMIPDNSSEEDLSNQTYVGLVRPNASSASNKPLSDLSLTASVMARDGSCARIVCGEVLAAIPNGYTKKETQILARHIMKNPKMVKLLSKKNLSSRKKQRSSFSSSVSAKGLTSTDIRTNGSKSQLGIQGKKHNYTTESTSGTFSSSVLFAPLSQKIEEEEVRFGSIGREKHEKIRVLKQEKIRNNVLLRNNSECKHYSGDVSCSSSIASMQSNVLSNAQNGVAQRNPSMADQVVTNMDMKDKLLKIDQSNPNTTCSFTSNASNYSPSPLIVDEETGIKDESGDRVMLTTHQLEEIKREAADAARVAARTAAEEAFTKRMEELIQSLNVSEDDKNRLIENDDISFHSAISFAMSPLSSSNKRCNFPGSVSICEPPLAPSVVRSLSPYGSHGAFASEVKFPSPMASSKYIGGLTLLAPKSSSPAPPLAEISPQSSDGSFQKYFEQDPSSINSRKTQGYHIRNSSNATPCYSETSYFDDYEDFETSLISEILSGFYEVTKKAVSNFISKKRKTLNELPFKLMQQNMHLKLMSIVCLIFLSSNLMAGANENNVNSLATSKDDVSMFQKESTIFPLNIGKDTKTNFTLKDLQHILFWFLVFSKGQHYLTLARPKRRERRAWKSRVIPID